ncbi:MAG: YihY family inner rane protein, partial [Deltaproteobacteria bacterium]|nr:YihY family inner rane protein [Deltaproteobacteria bacterium]
LDCIRNSGKKTRVRTDLSEEEGEINALLIEVEDSMVKTLAGKSLQEMILRLTPPEARE